MVSKLEQVWHEDPAKIVLVALVIAGLILRAVAAASWWPTNPNLADSWPYAYFAGHNLLGDPQHPAGYSLFLAAIGLLTRSVVVPTLLQHLLGVGAGVVLYVAVRRMTGAAWPAVTAAAVILLGADGVYLEGTIMAETLFILLMCVALWATVRAMEPGAQARRWPVLAGAIAGAAVIVRTEGGFMPLVLALSLLFAAPRPWRRAWRQPARLFGTAALLLILYAFANLAANGRFEVGPSFGWHIYARAAPIANCRDFHPPAGTARLCETTPIASRYGPDHYLFDPTSPAVQLFGHIGQHDGTLRAWALRALEAEPTQYLRTVWDQLKWYFVPSTQHMCRAPGVISTRNSTSPRLTGRP